MGYKLNQDITIRILLSMLHNHTFNAIRLGTERQGRWSKTEKVSPRHLKKYLTQMAIDHLIREEPHGNRPKYTIMKKGMSYLIDNSFFDILHKVSNIASILEAARKPELQLLFQEELTKRRKQSKGLIDKFFEGYDRDRKVTLNAQKFIDFLKNGPSDPTEKRCHEYFDIGRDPRRSNEIFKTGAVEELEKPLMTAVKKMFESELYFNGQIKNPQEVIENSCLIFMPGMRLRFAFDTRQLFKGPLPDDNARKFTEKIHEFETFCREIHDDKSLNQSKNGQ